MIILDKMIWGGLRFVFDKIAAAVDQELNDEEGLREQLLAAQMRLELGEITQGDFDALEAEVLARLRDIQERRKAAAGVSDDAHALASSDFKVSGVEATFGGDEGEEVFTSGVAEPVEREEAAEASAPKATKRRAASPRKRARAKKA